MNFDREYYNSKEFLDTLKKYEQAVKLNTIPYFNVEELADLLSYGLANNKFEIALNAFTFAKRLYPNTDECTRMEIRILLFKGEATKAIKLFDNIDIFDEELALLKAETHVMLKETQKAQEIITGLLKNLNADDEYTYYALEILLDCGLAQEVLMLCDKILKKAPHIKSIIEVRAESLVELQEIQSAVEIYNKLLDDEPYNISYWEQLGHIYYMTNKYGKALECFEYETDINPDIDYAMFMQALCYYRMRDYKRAKSIFKEQAQKQNSPLDALFYYALALYKEGDKEGALKIFVNIIKLSQEGSGETMVARVNKAMLLDEMGETTLAEDAMSMALLMKSNKDNRQFIFHDSHLYELKNKDWSTFEELNKYELAGWNEAEEIYQLGIHLVKYGHLILAKRVFNYVKELFTDPTDVDAYLAYILWKTDEQTEAQTAITNALAGKSYLVFELFDLPYNANIAVEEFIEQVKQKG